MKYDKIVSGKKCYLSPVNLEDAVLYKEWLNDLEVSSNLNFRPFILTLEKEKEMLEKLVKSETDVLFGIVDKKSDKLIGNCGLMGIEPINRKSLFGIFIGDKKYWGKGYGEEATNLILDFGFNMLNLHNIFLTVFSFNKRGIRCYEKCGFKHAGKLREARLVAGKHYDVVYMDILDREFKNSTLKNFIE
ncbi:MAG: GNAT family N-acetyltransferase [Candidatus Wallbacteria bacterium GWC2_49_35]|uniref:GNAT family N-acetyltransferase n=1 Tax=Candidatus Wallbacteria bacterium GWC2_49_35 TaxID=1817813 RepID=A0A1F7WZZ6_9BACT|nr:MAG: GNAT family N-acetyltransferase [Candidatus Wallbacteria bacterium GWC2_49_35]HBC73766.1 GNAT family N-acetyltransferase [Candidatus Wallbacteria bacterium]